MLQGNAPLPLQHLTTYIWNVAVGGVCLLLVTFALGSLMWNVFDAIRLGKHW